MEERDKVITVTGKGSLHVVPDVTRLELSLVSLHESYEEAYAQARTDTERLATIMEQLHLPVTLPKTFCLNIEKRTRTENDKHHPVGGGERDEPCPCFELDHRVKMDLGMDNVLLNRLIRLIGTKIPQAEIQIGYTLKDPRPAELRMLARAVSDAREKAAIMATACGYHLGLVKSIDYSTHELHIYSPARRIHGADEAKCITPDDLDITPDDLSVTDTVTVVWYLSFGVN